MSYGAPCRRKYHHSASPLQAMSTLQACSLHTPVQLYFATVFKAPVGGQVDDATAVDEEPGVVVGGEVDPLAGLVREVAVGLVGPQRIMAVAPVRTGQVVYICTRPGRKTLSELTFLNR